MLRIFQIKKSHSFLLKNEALLSYLFPEYKLENENITSLVRKNKILFLTLGMNNLQIVTLINKLKELEDVIVISTEEDKLENAEPLENLLPISLKGDFVIDLYYSFLDHLIGKDNRLENYLLQSYDFLIRKDFPQMMDRLTLTNRKNQMNTCFRKQNMNLLFFLLDTIANLLLPTPLRDNRDLSKFHILSMRLRKLLNFTNNRRFLMNLMDLKLKYLNGKISEKDFLSLVQYCSSISY